MAMKVIVDDGICSAKSSQGALHAKSILLDDLDQAGLVFNVPKSQLEPIQCGRWLGFLIDLGKGHSRIHRMYPKLHEYLQQVPLGEAVQVHFIASILGEIMSNMSLAFGSVTIWCTPMATRTMYSDASSYGGYVVVVGAQFAHGQWSVDEASCSST